jgi:hypothetical protein
MSEHGSDDPTVRMTPAPLRPASPSRPGRPHAGPWHVLRSHSLRWTGAAAVVALFAAGGGAWMLRHDAPVAALQQGSGTSPAPRFAVRTASEATILGNSATGPSIFRLDANAAVLVLDFPDLRQQGMMLNRVATLVEKIGLPRDRVLNDADLDAAIRSRGDTVETYYYGHDYAAADLARFFLLADRDAVRLTPEEEELRALLRDEGFLAPGARKALISIPREGAAPGIDAVMRRTILRHELSHAEFFSNPAYADYVRRFWNETLDAPTRQAFVSFLTASDYDAAVPDLFANEMQAYLMHTADPRMFSTASLGLSANTFARLQASFLIGMPPGWLRDCTALPSGISVSAGQKP